MKPLQSIHQDKIIHSHLLTTLQRVKIKTDVADPVHANGIEIRRDSPSVFSDLVDNSSHPYIMFPISHSVSKQLFQILFHL